MGSKKGAVLCTLLTVSVLAIPLFSQNDTYVNQYNSTGVESFRAYSGLQENINLYNDNLNIVIPLFTLKGRNGFDLPVVARYNSKYMEWVFHVDEFGNSYWAYELIPGLQWYDDLHFTIRLLPSWQHFGPSCSQSAANVYVFTEVDGTRHELFNRQWGEVEACDVIASDEVMDSIDSSHMRLRESGSTQRITFKNGTFAEPRQGSFTLSDTNGNTITESWDPTTSTMTVTDSLGRRVEMNNGTNIKDADGTQRTYKLTTTELIFPDATGAANGLRYQFEWQQFGPIEDPYGHPTGLYEEELVKVTHPTSGYTRYTWQLRASRKGPTRLTGKYVNANDGQGEAFWEYNTELPPSGGAEVKGPDGTYTRHYFDGFGQEYETQFWSADGILRKKVVRGWSPGMINPRIESETTMLEPNGANLQSKVEYSYDTNGYAGGTNGNITEIREYGFGTGAPGGLVRKTTRAYVVNSTYGIDGLHILDRKTQEIVKDDSDATKAWIDYVYDNYGAPRTLLDTPSAVQRDSSFGTSYTTRGNVTRISRWLNTTGTFLDTYFRYDICGNSREVTDPRGKISKTHYNVNYQYAYPYALEDAKGFTANRDYDFDNTSKNGFGYLTRAVDINGNPTTYIYDRLGRNKVINLPDGGSIESFYSDFDLTATHRSAFVFQDRTSSLPLRRKVYSKIQDSPYLEKVDLAVFDGFERDQMRSTSNNTQMDWIRTEYDGHARVKRVSNPISLANTTEIPAGTSFDPWTSNEYDVLDRITKLTTQDGQFVTTSYNGDVTTVTDQAGNARKSRVDALGRLVEVTEPNESTGSLTTGSYSTTYSYDVLDNLVQVTQGAQTRTFIYDSLGRLTEEKQPESERRSTLYAYDANSNLLTKTDPRIVAGSNVTISYDNYDELNRPASISYSDGTPGVSFTYDSVTSTNGKGRLTSRSETGLGSESYQYDPVGRISQLKRVFTGVYTLTHDYTYNFLGGVKKVTNPEVWQTPPLFSFKWTHDNAGRQITLTYEYGFGNPPTTITRYVVNNYTLTYSSLGAVETTDFASEYGSGNMTQEQVTYNNRLQPISRLVRRVSDGQTMMNLSYSFNRPGDSKNNGNVYQINDWVAPVKNQTFTYDYLNRISAFSSERSMTFGYDRYGNRHTQDCTDPTLDKFLSFNPSTNRITTPGYAYDEAGNLTNDGSHTYQYDAENRIKTVDSGVTATYSYDGRGNRVKRSTATETRYYFFDAFGRPVSERVGSNMVASNIYFNGKHTAVGGLRWMHSDHLGTPRMKVDNNAQVVSRDWYYPFGEQINIPADNIQYKFTGKERDAESGLDYFGARYYSSAQGRFTSPDEPLVDQYEEDPQSWNLYAYTRNNPLRSVDPNGRACRVTSQGNEYDDDNPGQSCADVREADKKIQPSAVVTAYKPGGLSPTAELILRSLYDKTASLTQPSTYAEAAAMSIMGGAVIYGISAGLTASATITELGIASAPAFQRALDYALRTNKLNHYFSDHHWAGFEPLVDKLGGKEAVVRAVLEKLGNISGPGRFERTFDVAGFQIVVKGYVGDGIVKLGDMWVSR